MTEQEARPVNGAQSVKLADIPTLDITKLTLGEMSDMEMESGQSIDKLLKGSATQRLMALWLQERRSSSEKPRSWRELRDLRVFDSSSSTLPSPSDGPSGTLKD